MLVLDLLLGYLGFEVMFCCLGYLFSLLIVCDSSFMFVFGWHVLCLVRVLGFVLYEVFGSLGVWCCLVLLAIFWFRLLLVLVFVLRLACFCCFTIWFWSLISWVLILFVLCLCFMFD